MPELGQLPVDQVVSRLASADTREAGERAGWRPSLLHRKYAAAALLIWRWFDTPEARLRTAKFALCMPDGPTGVHLPALNHLGKQGQTTRQHHKYWAFAWLDEDT